MLTSEFADEYGDWLDGEKAGQRARWLSLTLGELPYTTAQIVSPRMTIEAVVELMNSNHESAVLVVEDGRILGIFTERDVLVRVVPRVDGLFEQVGELMTRDPHVLTKATPLTSALRTLAIGGYHHLPVVDDDNHPFAIVSLLSVVAFLADAFPEEILNAPPERETFPPERYGA